MTAWRIPLSDVDVGVAEEEAVLRVIRSGWLTLGDEVLSFEREFAELHGADDAVACRAALLPFTWRAWRSGLPMASR